MNSTTMAYCGKCGNQIDEGVKFCPACGAALR
ncbi:MAG: zinc-ribbon domain-containing protein [Paludibacteraceae bacterium]|nr:zinc-ribbon domain-containing protein [Paludibacteraceae bacterium]